MKYFGDILFWGFLIVIGFILISDAPNAVYLTKGMVGAYTGGITDLAKIGQMPLNQPVPIQ